MGHNWDGLLFPGGSLTAYQHREELLRAFNRQPLLAICSYSWPGTALEAGERVVIKPGAEVVE